MVDYSSEDKLTQHADNNIRISKEYLKSRHDLGVATFRLHQGLAEKWKDGTIEDKMALEKALIKLSMDDNYSHLYEDYIKLKENCRGMEEVLKAIHSRISLGQSLIKNRIQEGA